MWTAQQLAEARDEGNPFDGEEDEADEEGSYVPCPVCAQKMQLRFVLAANIICPLLEVAAEAVALLHCGAARSILQAIVMVARAGKDRCPLHRSLLPGGVATNADLILTAETLIQDQLRRESAPAESSNTQRGPPGIAA